MITMDLEAMLEELNESDVTCNLKDLAGSVECLETVETAADFRLNIENALQEAETLLKSLRALKSAVA
jgi:hypothetical protein